MKKRLYIAVVTLLVALWGCTKVDVAPAPAKRVAFAVGSYVPQTKAAASLNSEGITAFSSKAYLYAEGVSGAQDFFPAAGETVSYNASVPEWAPSHDYYWPKGAESYVNFVSWYDKNGTPTAASETSLVWTIDGSTRSLAEDDNIMFADEAWRYNDNATEYIATSGVSEGVPTLFHHALARVAFAAKATPLSEGSTKWSVKITDVRLEGVKQAGTLSLSNADPGSKGTRAWWTGSVGSAPAWSLTGSPADLARPGVEFSLSEDGVAVPLIPTRSVLPQSTENMVLKFNYEIRADYDTTGGNYVVEKLSASIPLSEFSGGLDAWEMNQSITYTITVNPKTNLILFDPSSVDWNEDPNNKMYLE